MTFSSLRVANFPDGATAEQLERPDLKLPTAQNLREFAEDCGPYGLQKWAKAHDIALHYVDNCWVRAVVLGRDIPIFFEEVLGGRPALAPGIEPNHRYLIEAEEF